MKRVLIFFGILAFGGIIFVSFPAHDTQAECTSTKPAVRMALGLYSSDAQCNGGSQTATNPVPLSCPFSININAKDEDGCLTPGSGNIKITPSSNLTFLPRGGNPFLPWFRGTANGPANVSAELDGISANLSFSVGTGGGGGSGDPAPTFIPGDVGESDPFCAYQQGTSKVCVPGTEGATATTCTANATCVSKGGCTVIERSQCDRPTVTPNTYMVQDLPPGDLGAFIKRIFDVSLSVVGLTVFAMVVYGGFLMLLAGGLPSMNSEGKKYITNAFLGALLLFAAYVILNTINPNLVRQNGILPALPAQQVKSQP